MKTKVFLSGATGKMGLEIQALLGLDPQLTLGCILDRTSMLSPLSHSHPIWIDFSHDQFLLQLLQKMMKEKKYPCLLTGTTNLSDATVVALKDYSKFAPVLWTPNTSLGVGIIETLFPLLALGLKDYQWSLQETHHIQKKDAPSGTARRWTEKIQQLIKGKQVRVESFRESNVIGTHVLKIKGQYEEITLQHQATDRKLFAQGALMLTQQLIRYPFGYYDMESFLSQGQG